MTNTPTPTSPTRDHVHAWFGSSYSNYAVLHRTLLQSMPDEWQVQFVTLMRHLNDAYEHVPQADGYEVTAGAWKTIDECDDRELKCAGVTRSDEDPDVYYDKNSDELTSYGYVFVPGSEPVPHYNRGRTYIEPTV